MATQKFLAAVLRDRLACAGADPAADGEPPDPEDGLAAVAVLIRFDPSRLAESALRFAVEVDPDRRGPWLRAFTRTIFLAGNPTNLRDRFNFAQVAADRSIAWCGPAPAGEFTGLRRMLKLFPGGQLVVPDELPLRVPGRGRGDAGVRRLFVATRGLTVASYLVHLNHALVEAVLTDLLRPGGRVLVQHVPDIDDAALHAADAIRVHRDLADPLLLRAYACLSADTSQPGCT
jgi:hypothetical protein